MSSRAPPPQNRFFEHISLYRLIYFVNRKVPQKVVEEIFWPTWRIENTWIILHLPAFWAFGFLRNSFIIKCNLLYFGVIRNTNFLIKKIFRYWSGQSLYFFVIKKIQNVRETKNNAFIEIEEIYNKKYKNFEISYFITLKLCRTQKLKTDIIYESNHRVFRPL